MPHFDIIRESNPERTFRVESVMGTFDLQTDHVKEHFVGDIDLPNEWNIGIIVGRSGSGKTTIARELFGDNIIGQYEYTHDSILDDMPKDATVREISMALNSVGFSSPPSWLKPYAVLSNGEKMRCDIARAMLENKDFFVFDEFTSVVDRNVAQISSFAIQKAIRRNGKRFIAVTCHYDVQDWLMPDWVFNTDTMTFQTIDAETQKKNRPAINLEIREVRHDKQKIWGMFAKYHYLNHSFNAAARTFVCYANGHLAAFTSALHFMHPKKKKHRQRTSQRCLSRLSRCRYRCGFDNSRGRLFPTYRQDIYNENEQPRHDYRTWERPTMGNDTSLPCVKRQ